MQDELIKSYMEVLFEGKTEVPSHEVKGTVKPSDKSAFGDFEEGNESDENVSGELETPKECGYNSDDDTGTKESTKKLDKSSFNNPFDVLYSKILGENSFNFSTDDDNQLEPSMDLESDDSDLNSFDDLDTDLGEDDLGDDLGEEEDFGGEVDLKEVLGKLKDILSELEKIVSDEDEDEVDDIEDLDEDEDEEDEEEGEEEGEEESDDDLVKEESWKEAEARKEQREKRKSRLASKRGKEEKLKKASKYDEDEDEDLKESVKIKGLKKGVNLKHFSGNIKKLQNKKAEVSENKPKAVKSKAQTPSTGTGFDGVLKKLSPTAGHNLTKASSHTVSGAVKAGKSLFEQ